MSVPYRQAPLAEGTRRWKAKLNEAIPCKAMRKGIAAGSRHELLHQQTSRDPPGFSIAPRSRTLIESSRPPALVLSRKLPALRCWEREIACASLPHRTP